MCKCSPRSPPAAKFAILIDDSCDSHEQGRIARIRQAVMRFSW